MLDIIVMGMRILVVDDEQLVRWFLKRALSKWGHDVFTVSTVGEALAKIGEDNFEVVFTDLRMPGGNGTLLVEKLRDLATNHKIVVCSAYITSEMENEFKKNGIFYLKKPFKIDELEKTLNKCVV